MTITSQQDIIERLQHLMIESASKLEAGDDARYIAQRLTDFAQCSTCLDIGYGLGPSHEASASCKSGKHNHCTCDTCF